jgi:hypothetical protein
LKPGSARDRQLICFALVFTRQRQQVAIDLLANSRDGGRLWEEACEFLAGSGKMRAQGFSASDAWSRLAEFLALLRLILPTRRVLERGQRLHATQGKKVSGTFFCPLPIRGFTRTAFLAVQWLR